RASCNSRRVLPEEFSMAFHNAGKADHTVRGGGGRRRSDLFPENRWSSHKPPASVRTLRSDCSRRSPRHETTSLLGIHRPPASAFLFCSASTRAVSSANDSPTSLIW